MLAIVLLDTTPVDEDGRDPTEGVVTTTLLDTDVDGSDCSKAVEDEIESAVEDVILDEDGCCTTALDVKN